MSTCAKCGVESVDGMTHDPSGHHPSPARMLAEKILANLREPISGTIEEMERNELLEIESIIQAELENARKQGFIDASPMIEKELASAKREAYEEGYQAGRKSNG